MDINVCAVPGVEENLEEKVEEKKRKGDVV